MTTAFAAALAAGPALAGPHSASTKDVVMSLLGGVGQMNLDAIVASYSDDAKLVTAEKIYNGPDEIRTFFEIFIAVFSQPDISMETKALVCEGNTALAP